MLFWLKKCKRLVFRMVQQFCRRVAEGSPKSRRERILADINARPPDKRELGNFRDRIAIHNGRDGAGQEKKRKSPPQEKSPQQKKRNRCLRLRLLTGGCAAPPLCFSSRASFGRLRRPPLSLLFSLPSAAAPPHSPPRSRGRLVPPTLPLHYEIASLRDAHGDRYSSIPRLRKSEIFLSGVIEIEPLRGLFCCRHKS